MLCDTVYINGILFHFFIHKSICSFDIGCLASRGPGISRDLSSTGLPSPPVGGRALVPRGQDLVGGRWRSSAPARSARTCLRVGVWVVDCTVLRSCGWVRTSEVASLSGLLFVGGHCVPGGLIGGVGNSPCDVDEVILSILKFVRCSGAEWAAKTLLLVSVLLLVFALVRGQWQALR